MTLLTLFQPVFGSHIGRALGADSGEKSGLASDIDTDSLKVLDPKWPIREADIGAQRARALRCGSRDDLGGAKRFGEGPLCGIVR